ncbi:restriction endonuclease subunit S [Limosilactobacillus reuteri]|uniref:restriction endonuclease subunit S n=3 Tax=Limosilactobacillus reuteri TaxID=1598 RepID=UPI001E645A4A|nr:restriction endonuclease subunit S [Limosilactobacillus reuteri]MCC4370357.1 restriction endonuclease subunit S [Limosilactobacillus reuteri]
MDKKPEKLVPEVRFKGFTDDWEQRKLGEISKRVRNNDGRMNLPLLTISARYGWMTQQSRFSASIAGREKKNYTLLKKHQLSYNHGNSKVANYGTVYELTDYDEALVPKVYHSFSLTSENSSKFIESYFHTKKLDAQLRKFIASTARMDGLLNISFDDFMKVKLFAPERCEQSKISRIINLIEKLITLQQRKMEQLKQLKKAMLQQLFVNKNNKQPILKFKNFRNNWREYKLSEIVNLEDNKRKPVKATERIRGKIPYYGANGIQDYVKGYTHIGKHVLIAEDGANSVDDYPIYFIYSPSWINNHTHVLTAKEEILSSEFLAYALKKINYAKYLVGSGRYKLNAEILKLIPLKIPTMNEQKYIESNLSKIDKLIALQQNKLTQLTALKKYLLQKLFI